MQIKLWGIIANFPQLCVEKTYTFFYKPLFKYASSSKHWSDSSSVPVVLQLKMLLFVNYLLMLFFHLKETKQKLL